MDGPGYNGMLQIYDSEGRAVRTLMQSELLGLSGSISWDGFRDDKLKASVGIYVIYFEAFNTEGNVVKTKKTCVLAHSLD
jgi:flagellar hook assembly protein FlgD